MKPYISLNTLIWFKEKNQRRLRENSPINKTKTRI
jgi:hypothetical protein